MQRACGGYRLYRPPSNATLLLHNLKNGGFNVGWELMQPNAPPYDHARCTADRLRAVKARKGKSGGRHGRARRP